LLEINKFIEKLNLIFLYSKHCEIKNNKTKEVVFDKYPDLNLSSVMRLSKAHWKEQAC